MSLVSQNRPELIFIYPLEVGCNFNSNPGFNLIIPMSSLRKVYFLHKRGCFWWCNHLQLSNNDFLCSFAKEVQSSDFKFLFFIYIYWVILNKVEIFLPFSPIEFSRPGENCFHWVFIAPTLPLLQGRRISLSSVYPPPPPWINWLQDNDQDQNLQSQAPLI